MDSPVKTSRSLSPTAPVFDYFIRMQTLNYLERTNLFVRNHSYSVAVHSYQATLLAMYLADEWNQANKKNPVNVEVVMRKMLLHDVAEAVVSDIPYPIRHNGALEKTLDEVENSIISEKIFSELPNYMRGAYIQHAINCKDDSPEGRIVAVCDMLELFFHCYVEFKSGNFHQTDLIENVYKYLLGLTKNYPEARALTLEIWATMAVPVKRERIQHNLLSQGGLAAAMSLVDKTE